MAARLRVGILYGGRSGEHQVSVVSAANVAAALDPERYEVLPIGIAVDGRWLPGIDPQALIDAGEPQVRLPGAAEGRLNTALLSTARDGKLLAALAESLDVIIPVLHGPYGEDGTVQGLLELTGIPYVGGGVLASAVGMDKGVMKAVFQHAGLPVAPYLVFSRKEWEKARTVVTRGIGERLGYPCFVKPANLGSSVGISKAHNEDELGPAMDLAVAYDRRVVVEANVDGREIECAVLGNDEPIASVPGEIVPCEEFYDYKAKYIDRESRLLIPAPIAPEIAAKIQELATGAFKAIDGAGLARVDFFLTRADNEIFINEINTMPGFTNISMYPKLWEAGGLKYSSLIDRLIELAMERHAERSSRRIL
jgi:D-alanine-D-alanine ligase